MEDGIKWLWKVTDAERFFEPYTTSYRLSLATTKPLQEEHFVITFRHLFRKVPSLRTCFGERNGERWLREMTQEIIDFEMISDGSSDELLSKLQQYEFNKTSGPLWCVKVKEGEEGSAAEYPHVYDLFLGVNHVISDGTSNVRICGFITHLIDDVISERDVDDAEQLGAYISDEKTAVLIEKQATVLEADPQLRSSLKAEYEALQSRNSLFKSTFKRVGEREAKSVMMTRDLDYNTTSSFIKRCRSVGVTFNSAYTAVANIAMVDLLAEGGLVLDTYGIRSDHVIDSRRYWEEDTSRCLGLHLLPLVSVIVETPRNASESLWSYIKSTHEQMMKKIKTIKPLQEIAVMRSEPNAFRFEYEYSISNMGDVTKQLTDGLRNVRVIHMRRSSMIHVSPCLFCHYIHTLCGRLNVTLVNNSFLVDQSLASRYIEKIFYYFHKSVQE